MNRKDAIAAIEEAIGGAAPDRRRAELALTAAERLGWRKFEGDATVTWIVRYVDARAILQVRTFYTEEAALAFMARQPDVRAWAEVRTFDREVPATS